MNTKDIIYNFYFIDKLSCVDIADKIGISKQAVSKTLKKFPEYEIEKEHRKSINKKKHNKQIAECVSRKRQEQSEFNKIDKEEDEAIYAGMMMLQAQNAVSMSRKRKIGDDSLLKIYLNAYDYNKDKHSIVFNERVGRCPNDLPEKKYWR